MKKAGNENMPRHVAVIMDGNGRWAKARGLPRIKGHEAGAEAIRRILRACRKAGVPYLTLYAFSAENWQRPRTEVNALMSLLLRFIKKYEYELHENEVRLHVIGRMSDLPPAVSAELNRAIDATSKHEHRHLVLALSYGGRAEIADAAKKIAAKALKRELDVADIGEETVAAHLYAPDVPDPDMVIRTSGEMRISNFLLWQISYSELYVTPVLWPDFGEEDFMKAMEEYQRRERRFGK